MHPHTLTYSTPGMTSPIMYSDGHVLYKHILPSLTHTTHTHTLAHTPSHTHTLNTIIILTHTSIHSHNPPTTHTTHTNTPTHTHHTHKHTYPHTPHTQLYPIQIPPPSTHCHSITLTPSHCHTVTLTHLVCTEDEGRWPRLSSACLRLHSIPTAYEAQTKTSLNSQH